MENIRNFAVISHIDAGKSTLADRFLELTETVQKRKMQPQYLDMMPLERERGITIKMQPVRMKYKDYTLNLIDTPGHVDFTYEVSRSLEAVEGALLLVDATKGIQAQTLGNLELARQQELAIIPVVNKIDLPQARVAEAEKEIADLLEIDSSEIIKISAKEGTNIEEVLEAVTKRIPPPRGNKEKPLRALIFDSKYDPYKGVLAFVRVFEGEVKKDQQIYLIQTEARGEVKETGIFNPELRPVESLSPGEIGYLATGIKESGKVRVGDTITKIQNSKNPLFPHSKTQNSVLALPGYKEPQPKVFISLFPVKSEDYELLKSSLERLKLNDPALVFQPELKEALGRGFRCGFLGLLHAEIVTERLKREFNLDLVLSAPSVVYKIINQRDQEELIYTSADWPQPSEIKESKELWIKLKVLTPTSYLGRVLELLEGLESRQLETRYLGSEKVELIYESPLREIVTKNFYDKLKGISQGFASMDYQISEWRQARLVKLDILVLGRKEEALSRIVPEKEAQREGRKILERLKEALPSQLFSVPLQAALGGKIIARETLRARGKDVIAPLYGGDYSRKRKLLEKQKKGKKELKEKGRIKIPSKVFLEVFKS
ncbi:MAG: elongation factor 4 [Candidatus Nealsonbacteria bacterium]|nr:MAG: elongation factor 4 [Candidatus Nealsonbacteria bacterium]